jgi:hypothetical protein
MTRNGGLLAHFRRRDHLLVAPNGLHPVAEVVDGAIPLAEILGAVQMDQLARFNAVRRLAIQKLRSDNSRAQRLVAHRDVQRLRSGHTVDRQCQRHGAAAGVSWHHDIELI